MSPKTGGAFILQYTARTFIKGRNARLDEICRIFCSMERTSYNLLRGGMDAAFVKATTRARYSVQNARWIQSAINQAKVVMASQEEGIAYRIEMYTEKVRNMREKMKRISNPLKVRGCERKVERLRTRIDELRAQIVDGSYPKAVFGSKKLHHQLSIALGERREKLRAEWTERRSNRFFSVGQANQRGNGNMRLLYSDEGPGGFGLEIRNWPGGDFRADLQAPDVYSGLLRDAVKKAESVGLIEDWRPREGRKGLPYSVRVVRSDGGYQVLVSFNLDEPSVEWNGRIAGIDINPEGIGCTVVSADGNLIATRGFTDSRFVTASANKRKWLLENVVNRMLKWCRDTYRCNAVAVEDLKLRGAYDYSPKINFKLSNFMKRKMLQRIILSALKMNMLTVEVDPAYSSKVAVAKYGRRFGGFNRHQLAAFVIARRALGYGEAPALDCLPKTRKERTMWNRCVRYYGYSPRIQTLPWREPMERKSAVEVNGRRGVTELLTAPPAITPSRMGLGHSPSREGANDAIEDIIRRAGRVRPNGQASRGDGARGRRVNPPGVEGHRSAVIFDVIEDAVVRQLFHILEFADAEPLLLSACSRLGIGPTFLHRELAEGLSHG
jgi:flavin-binding protein dodecin